MNKGQFAIVGSIVGLTTLAVATANPIPGDELGIALFLAIGALVLLGSGGGYFSVNDVFTLET